MRYVFAPLEGVTDAIFREVHHRMFPGADRYYMPFFSPTSEHLFTPRELRQLLPEHNRGLSVVPQILTKNAEDFLWAAHGLAEMGYTEVNLNLGCPSATVVAKGKGAGLLACSDELDAMLDTIFSRTEIAVSVKTRIGVNEPSEWTTLLAIYDRYPLAELIVHPRTKREMYRSPVHMDAFDEALRGAAAPLCYNGELFTPEDVAAFAKAYPTVPAVMLGRGAAADPAFFRTLRGGAALTKEELFAFHRELYAAYRAEYGVQNAMRRMKEHWYYLACLLENGETVRKKIARTQDVGAFEYYVADAFQTRTLRPVLHGRL